MKTILLVALQTLFLISVFPGCAGIAGEGIPPALAHDWPTPVRKTMRPFRSEQELAAYLKQLAEKQRQSVARSAKKEAGSQYSVSPAPASLADAQSADESVTNVQHAGVD